MTKPDLRAMVEAATVAELPEILAVVVARLITATPASELPALAGRLREAELLVEMRLRAQATSGNADASDTNLSAKETARRLGVSLPYLYKHADEYPFKRQEGGRVLFSARGLDAYMRRDEPLTARSLEG